MNYEKTDQEKRSELYVRADAVLQAAGQKAPLPSLFESSDTYRHRLARIVQPLGKPFQDVRLDRLDAPSFDAIENAIYKAAGENAQTALNNIKGRIVEVKERDRAGREITKSYGDMDAWLNTFKLEPKRIRFKRPTS